MKAKYFLPSVFFGMLIIISSALPMQPIKKLQHSNFLLRIILSNYCLHFFAFGIFTVLLCYGFYKSRGRISSFLVGLLAFSFGLFIEIFQIFIPDRSFGLDDLIPSFAGTVVALVIIGISSNSRKSQAKKH